VKVIKGQEQAPPSPKREFKAVLKQASLAAKGQVACRVLSGSAAPATAKSLNLNQARAVMNTEAKRLGEVRSEAANQDRERIEERLLALLSRETVSEPAPAAVERAVQPPPLPSQRLKDACPEPSLPSVIVSADALKPSSPRSEAEQRAQAAHRLIEKIETFMRSHERVLALTVGEGLEGRVEMERTGPGAVAIKIQGKHGPPSAQDLSRIRDEIRSRGLYLSALSIG
jgi:hypothetical protein